MTSILRMKGGHLFEAISQNPTLALVALLGLSWVARELYGYRVATEAKEAARVEALLKSVSDKESATSTTVNGVVIRQDELTRQLGALGQRTDAAFDKIQGLQDYWTAQFEKLSTRLHDDNKQLVKDVHDALTAHRSTVHERLNQAAAAQAETVTQLFERIETLIHDRKS